jgi:gas vesicle structural protein
MAIERTCGTDSLLDVLDRVLDKGIVVDAWVRVSQVGITGVLVEARVVVRSAAVGPFDDSPTLDTFGSAASSRSALLVDDR